MKFHKKYQIKNWRNWHDTINQTSIQFYEEFSFFPTILEANDYTFSQFDFLININPNEKENVTKNNELTNQEEIINKNEEVKIAGFKTTNTDIDFAIDEELNDKEFRLVYDSDAEWDNDDMLIDLPFFEKDLVMA